MADIKIYGTLKNDTGEPIAYASQIYDITGKKTILQIIDEKIQAIDFPEYKLPAATNDTLGGVIIGNHLMVHDGLISVYDAADDRKGVISETKVKGLAQDNLLTALSEFTGQTEKEPEEGEESAHPFFPEYAKLVAFGSWAMTDGAFAIFKAKMDEPALKDFVSISDNTITIGEDSLTIPSAEDIEAVTEEKVKAAVDKIVDGAPDAYDTLKEIGTWITTHEDAYELLNTAIVGKADKATTLAGYGITDASISADGTITLGGKTIKPITEHQSLSGYVTSEVFRAARQSLEETDLAAEQEIKKKADQTTVDALSERVDSLENVSYMTETEGRELVANIFK